MEKEKRAIIKSANASSCHQPAARLISSSTVFEKSRGFLDVVVEQVLHAGTGSSICDPPVPPYPAPKNGARATLSIVMA